jgi:uncharacterized membrane protein YdbT with pleckstrin-like domain
MRTTTLLLTALLLLTACGGPRKACRKAERHVAKAAMLCPELMRNADQVVELPGDSVVLPPVEYAAVDVDSLMAACEQLAEAMRNERDLFAHQLMMMPGKPLLPVKQAVGKLRATACKYQPFTYDHELFTITASGGSTPNVEVSVKPRKASVPCPPQVVVDKAQHDGRVAGWYRTASWVLFALLVLMALLAYVMGSMISTHYRNSPPYL